jgi:hypothetical protein
MELKLLGVLIIILKLPSLSSATRPRRFDNSLRRNGFKVQRKRSRLLGWCHTHPRLGMAGTWCLLITCKKPGSRSFIRSRTVVKQFQRFQGPLCRIVPTASAQVMGPHSTSHHRGGGGEGAKNSGPNPRSFSEFRPNSYQEMTVNDGCQCAGGAFSQNYGPPESSGSHRRPRFPNLRNVFANLQSYHRDLCIDTLPTCST